MLFAQQKMQEALSRSEKRKLRSERNKGAKMNETSQSLNATNRMMQYFKYDHLPERLKPVSQACCELAQKMAESLPEGAEKTAGLRKLLEAKDCFVRTLL
jgi:hypothetical protein